MDLIKQADSILIIQPENPDGDSLASALALDQMFYDMEKEANLFCPVNMPRHLRYIPGWDRVKDSVEQEFDLSIIVDTSAMNLLEKLIAHPEWGKISSKPIIIIDHHDHDPDLQFDFIDLSDRSAAATSEVIFDLAKQNNWPINQTSAGYMIISIMSDTLGLSSVATSPRTLRTVAELMEYEIKISDLEAERRKAMIRPAEITKYKGELLQRIEYRADGELAFIVIPWEEIEQYSDKFNPSVLVIEDMRLTEGVGIAIALKIYSDGKITGKLRANNEFPYAARLANALNGGGHTYAAGFKVTDMDLNQVINKLLEAYQEIKNETV